ncbi:IclR family transcriptional regulator [Rhodococcus koreensis]
MMLGTVTKAGKVLDLFTATSPEWGVREVADRLQIPKSSAHALLATLSDIGLVRRLAEGRYRLGWRIVELNRTLIDSTDLLTAARPQLGYLADQLRATVQVAALREDAVIVLDKIVGAGISDFSASAVGRAAPIHCSALGKVLLAHLDVCRVDTIVERHGLEKRTTRTITSSSRFRAELEAVRLRGCGYDIEESTGRQCCVAAPVRDAEGDVYAAISITLPLHPFRRNPEMVRRAVQRAAARVSKSSCPVVQRQVEGAS